METMTNNTVEFTRPRTGKKYTRRNGVWYTESGRKLPESGKGTIPHQWQIEAEYKAKEAKRD